MAISPSPPISPASILTLLLLLIRTHSATSIFELIYKGCANHQFSSQQNLSSLSSTLISQSTASKFSTTTSPDHSLSALFQCRGDLSASDCSACVSKAVSMWNSLCADAVAARVQLRGCYVLYEIAGFPQASGMQVLYRICGVGNGGGEGFVELRDAALFRVERGVSEGGGFFDVRYEGVYAMAQCEGDVSEGDCGECVEEAVRKLQVECGGVGSGQVYFDKCYVGYENYADGGGSGGGEGAGGGGGVFW